MKIIIGTMITAIVLSVMFYFYRISITLSVDVKGETKAQFRIGQE